MFTEATGKNKVVKSELCVTYTSERKSYTNASQQTVYYWDLTRRATKKYSFVGLTESAALSIADNKAKMYTRPCTTFGKVDADHTTPTVVTFSSLQAQIVPVRESGSAWRVDISVDETDRRYSSSEPYDVASCFSDENKREYDEGDGTITLLSAEIDEWGYFCVKFSGLTEWSPFTSSIKAQTDARGYWEFEKTSSSATWGELYVNDSPARVGDKIRLCYGSYKTDPLTITQKETA